MNRTSQGSKGKAAFFALLAVISVFACFILSPLGDFIAWIFGGVATYSLFLSVYSLIPTPRKQFTRVRYDPRQAETKAYIAFHKPILFGLFAFTLLVVLLILLLVR